LPRDDLSLANIRYLPWQGRSPLLAREEHENKERENYYKDLVRPDKGLHLFSIVLIWVYD